MDVAPLPLSAKALRVLGESQDTVGCIKSGFTSQVPSRRGSIGGSPTREPSALRAQKSLVLLRDPKRREESLRSPLPSLSNTSASNDHVDHTDASSNTTPQSATFSDTPSRHGTQSSVGSSAPTSDASRSAGLKLTSIFSRKSGLRAKSSMFGLRDDTSQRVRRVSPERSDSHRTIRDDVPLRRRSPEIREWFDRLEEYQINIDLAEAYDGSHPSNRNSIATTTPATQDTQRFELDSHELASPTFSSPRTRPFSNAATLNVLESPDPRTPHSTTQTRDTVLSFDHHGQPIFRYQPATALQKSPKSRRSSSALGALIPRGTSILSLSDSESESETPRPTKSSDRKRVAKSRHQKHRESSILLESSSPESVDKKERRSPSTTDGSRSHRRRTSRESVKSVTSNVWVPPTEAYFHRRSNGSSTTLNKDNLKRLGSQKYMAVTSEEARLLANLRMKRAEMQSIMLRGLMLDQSASSSARTTVHLGQPIQEDQEGEEEDDTATVAGETASVINDKASQTPTSPARSVGPIASRRLLDLNFPAPPTGAIPYNKPLPPKPHLSTVSDGQTTLVGSPLSPAAMTSDCPPVPSLVTEVSAANTQMPKMDVNGSSRSSSPVAERKLASLQTQRISQDAMNEKDVQAMTPTLSEAWELATPRVLSTISSIPTESEEQHDEDAAIEETPVEVPEESTKVDASPSSPSSTPTPLNRRELVLPRLVQELGGVPHPEPLHTRGASSSTKRSSIPVPTDFSRPFRPQRMSRLSRAEGFIIRS